MIILFSSFINLTISAQTVLLDYHFNTSPLPAEITSDGALSITKAADGVCSQGALQVNSGGYMQVDLLSCSVLTINMKSTGPSSRLVTVKYKKDGASSFSIATTTLLVQAAASYNFTTLFPAINTSGPISVRIEPTNGNIQIHDIYVLSQNVASSVAEITAFKINGQIGNEIINSVAGTIALNVPLGTSINPIAPQLITLSPFASISPLANATQNFTVPVNYTVTAQNGATKNWVITVTQVASTAKEINDFKLSNTQIGSAAINSTTGAITVSMPLGSNLIGLVPSIFTISALASVTPGITTAQDFTTPVTYTVTAQDNSTKIWIVNVILVDPNLVFTDYEAEEASFTGTVDNNHTGFTGTGFINFNNIENSINFTVCQQVAGNRTAKFRYSLANDTYRKGNLYVNDVFVQLLNFTRTATFTDWAEEIATVNLLAGINNIKILWDTTDGPNLDKLMLSGAACTSYTLTVTSSNGGTVSKSPARTNNKYFEGETVTLLAQVLPALRFDNWTGNLSGNVNPGVLVMNGNKTIAANFSAVPTYKLNVSVTGVGGVSLNPPGGDYAENTVVTLTANPILNSTFSNWTGNLTGTNPVQTITMNTVKNVTANFNSSYNIDFDRVIGFASINADGFNAPTTGGQCALDTLVINGPAEFNKLCEALYNRQQAFKTNTTVGGMKKAPLVILLKAGIYDATQTLSTNGAKVFGNYMLDIPEQGSLSFVGESNVIFKIGINVKRSWNVLIRNIFFQDYYDDGINIGYPETHHIWIDHCTLGSPLGFPADPEHPDGGCDVKDGASYVTISWCLFRNSWKTGLNGHSDNNGATDIGRLKITYVNNYFYNTNSRNPRVRFGEVHVLNNLFEQVQLYGTVAANSARVLVENNFYLNTDWPMYADRTVADFKTVFGNNTDNTYTSKTGNIPCVGLKQRGNAYDDSGLPIITAQINPAMLNPGGRSIKFDELNPVSIFEASSYYNYTPFTAAETKVLVPLFAGADKVSFALCSSLPLNFLKFTGELVNDNTTLYWQTTNEVNTKQFEIEKSTNSINFVKIGVVISKNNLAINSYEYTDNEYFTGKMYYRLKQIDKDGKYNYSQVISVANIKKFGFTLYPNPAKNKIIININNNILPSKINIISADGKKLITVSTKINEPQTSIDISKLIAGTYYVLIENASTKQTLRFQKWD